MSDEHKDNPRGPENAAVLLGPSKIWLPDNLAVVAIAALVFSTTVLRRHPRRQRRCLEKLIRHFGFCVPILIDQDNRIIAGELRVLVAQALGMTHVPAVYVKHLTEPEVRALRIADNKLPEMSSSNNEVLAIELAHLAEIIDIELTGFAVPEVDLLIDAQIAKSNATAVDDCPAAQFSSPAITSLGNILLCGQHRIACGDARDPDLIARLMSGAVAAQYLGDVPYNLEIPGTVSGLGKVKHDNFIMASGEMSDAEFKHFLEDSIGLAARHCKEGALIHVFIDWRHVHQVIEAGRGVGLNYFHKCIWAKTNAGMGSFYRSQYEEIVIFKKGNAPHTNNIELGRYGRNRSNLWKYEGANSINPNRRKELRLHPTVKPAQLCIDAILDCTKRGEIVLDTFLGSGTSLISAEDSGRICYGCELSPHYVDVAVRRWQEFTGEQAVFEASGRSFTDIERERDGATALMLPPPKPQYGACHDQEGRSE